MASFNSEEDDFRLRSYQTEMVDASIERNIIVAVGLNLDPDRSPFVSNAVVLDGYGKRKDSNVCPWATTKKASDSCQSRIASTSCVGDKCARKGNIFGIFSYCSDAL